MGLKRKFGLSDGEEFQKTVKVLHDGVFGGLIAEYEKLKENGKLV